MGAAASTKNNEADVSDDSECQPQTIPIETAVEDLDMEWCQRFGSKSSLHLRGSNASLEEVDLSLIDSQKVLKTSDVPNGVAFFHQDKPVLTRARLASKRLDTPFVGYGMSFEPPGRRESITNTKGIDLLQIHEDNGNKRKFPKEQLDERPPSRLARSMKMDNTDILQSGRNNMFNSKSVCNPRDERPALHPQGKTCPNQIGKHGIVHPDSATERSVGETRRMSSNLEEMSYVPSVDAPRRLAPRLAPITSTKNSLTESMRKPPWERSVLSNDRNYGSKGNFDVNPHLFNNSGKSWSDDVMPLEIRLNTGCRMKVKMMDDSDHG